MTKSILIVSTSANKLKSGHPTGLWLEELAAPYYAFKEAGFKVTVASVSGGEIPVDETSIKGDALTPVTKKFMDDAAAMDELKQSVALDSVTDEFDAYYLPGGHGTAVDFPHNAKLQELISSAWKNGKIVSSVCHGPIGLANVKVDGEYLVKGKSVTGFSNTEEEGVGLTADVNPLLEDALKEHGGKFSKGKDWGAYAVADGKLITGQNPMSSEAVAEKVIAALKA